MIDLLEYGFTWFCVAFCLCYGISGLIKDWDEFSTKLINTLAILTTAILSFIFLGYNNEISDSISTLIIPYAVLIGCIYIGAKIEDEIDDDDWKSVFFILAAIFFIAMIVSFITFIKNNN